MLNGSKMPSSLAFKCQTWLIFCISVFYWWKQKISHSFGKICKCIWNILLSLFRKCYGLFWAIKIQDFDIVDSAIFFFFLIFLPSIHELKQRLFNQPYHFLKHFKKIFQVHLCPILKCTVISRRIYEKWAIFDIL